MGSVSALMGQESCIIYGVWQNVTTVSVVRDFVNRATGKTREPYDAIEESVNFDDDSFVYFVRAGATLKIGFTGDLKQRLTRMQTDSPEVLVLVGAARGGEPLERELHRRLSSDKISGEWFKLNANVVAVVTSVLRSPRAVIRTPQPVREFLKQKEKKT